MLSLSRAVIDSLLPPGSLWSPMHLGDLDNLLNGVADNMEDTTDDLAVLADLRNPYKTTMLADLEKEYGVRPNTSKTELERRQGLAAVMANRVSDGSLDTLQDKLDLAGFDLTVYANDPAVVPDGFLTESYGTVCGYSTSVCGHADAYCGFSGGVGLLVNGDVFDDRAFTIPSDSGYWSLFFFIGGAATYLSGGGLDTIAMAPVANARRDELKRLILKYKPMHMWCGLIIYFL